MKYTNLGDEIDGEERESNVLMVSTIILAVAVIGLMLVSLFMYFF